jgi:hypothetical protein
MSQTNPKSSIQFNSIQTLLQMAVQKYTGQEIVAIRERERKGGGKVIVLRGVDIF